MKNSIETNSREASIQVILREGTREEIVSARAGDRLIDVLWDHESIISPCGGKGTCKKCHVNIRGLGLVLACRHRLLGDIEVDVLHHSRQKILESGLNQLKPQSIPVGDSREMAPNNSNYGFALDVGTTTVVIYLENISLGKTVGVRSFVNPQAAFGSDVISRISFVMERQQGLARLQTCIVAKINNAMSEMCREISISEDEIAKITVVGNPTMLHLLLGVDPRSLAFSPYVPVFTETKVVAASAIGINAVGPDALVVALPSIAGYVGADVVAGIASTPMAFAEEFSLYIDIGTNGEMAIGNRDSIFCCSTAAGPAFEGARISCGVGGVDGAICSYDEGVYQTISGGPPIGICGSGIVDIVAGLVDKGEIDSSGFMESAAIIERAENTKTGADILLTPGDVREVQLAKAAIASGIGILLKDAGAGFNNIDRVYLAGAFGNFMNIKNAARLGMIPQELVSKVVCIGNAAGEGARRALRSQEFERSLKRIAGISKYVELSCRPDFNEAFVNEMKF